MKDVWDAHAETVLPRAVAMCDVLKRYLGIVFPAPDVGDSTAVIRHWNQVHNSWLEHRRHFVEVARGLLIERSRLKAAGDFKKSDMLRKDILAMGLDVRDGRGFFELYDGQPESLFDGRVVSEPNLVARVEY